MQYTERPIYVAVGREMEGRWRKREEHLPRNKMAPVWLLSPLSSLSRSKGYNGEKGEEEKSPHFERHPLSAACVSATQTKGGGWLRRKNRGVGGDRVGSRREAFPSPRRRRRRRNEVKMTVISFYVARAASPGGASLE